MQFLPLPEVVKELYNFRHAAESTVLAKGSILPILTLAVAGLLSFAAASYTAFMLSPDNTIRSLAQSCNLPSRQKLPTDFSKGALPLLDNTLCTTMGFFKANTAKRLNVGLFAIMVAFTLPLSYRLSFQAASPNRKSTLNSGFFLVPLNIIGAAAGVGPWSCLFFSLVYLPAAYSSMKASKASVLPVPTPSSNIYLANLMHVVFGTTVALAIFAACQPRVRKAKHEKAREREQGCLSQHLGPSTIRPRHSCEGFFGGVRCYELETRE